MHTKLIVAARCCLSLVAGLALSAASSLTAQARHVVPAAFADREAPGVAEIAGFTYGERQQILIGSSLLDALRGRTLVGITWRRDTGFGTPLEAGRAELVVRMGTAARPVLEPSRVLDENITAPIEVFRGTAVLPVAPAVSAYAGWEAPSSVTIQFSVPFAYSGADLVLDIEGAPSPGAASAHWPVDAALDDASGTVRSISLGCGPHAGANGMPATVAPRELALGRTALFSSRGVPGDIGSLLFGIGVLHPPLDLTVIGAPGCTLQVDAFAAIATGFATPEFGSALGGLANVATGLPRVPVLAGARFVVQWVDLGASIATSNALACEIAVAVPALPMSIVTRERSGAGRTFAGKGPVLGFEYR